MLDVIEVSQRVEKGGDFLEEKFGPRWPWMVDLETLQMRSSCLCVAGQLHDGGFWSAMHDWFGIDLTNDPASATADDVAHGFNLAEGTDDEIGEDEVPENWDLLESAWRGLITVRRSRQEAQA